MAHVFVRQSRLPRRSTRRLAVIASAGILVLALGGPAAATGLPSGEHMFGQVSVEPAYNDATGSIVYLATPIKAPDPSKSSVHAMAPLYLVVYPASSPVGTLNCMGVPGNCPDHDGPIAGLATTVMPTVYGTDPSAVLGHDHLVSVPAGGGDFNIAWNVVAVLFTNPLAATHHLTTEAQVEWAVSTHNAIKINLGFAFDCAVVPAVTYSRG